MATQDVKTWKKVVDDFLLDSHDEAIRNQFFKAILQKFTPFVMRLCQGNKYNIQSKDVLMAGIEKIMKISTEKMKTINHEPYFRTIFKNSFISILHEEGNLKISELNPEKGDYPIEEEEDDDDWLDILYKYPEKILDNARPPLTKREREILDLLILFPSYENVAEMLKLNLETVRNTVYIAKKKLPKGRKVED